MQACMHASKHECTPAWKQAQTRNGDPILYALLINQATAVADIRWPLALMPAFNGSSQAFTCICIAQAFACVYQGSFSLYTRPHMCPCASPPTWLGTMGSRVLGLGASRWLLGNGMAMCLPLACPHACPHAKPACGTVLLLGHVEVPFGAVGAAGWVYCGASHAHAVRTCHG